MASSLTRTFLFGSRGTLLDFPCSCTHRLFPPVVLVVQTSFTRTLATGQAKGPMDYVKQGVDQLGQAAEKVKEAVSSATSTMKDAVSGDQHASKDTVCCAIQHELERTLCVLSRQKSARS